MPELPEVETIARALQAQLPGEVIAAVEVRWPRSIATPSAEAFAAGLPGRRIVQVARRAKFVVLELDRGYLLVHLRMTGRLLVAVPPAGPPNALPAEDAYTRVVIHFTSGKALLFRDLRKFGRLYLVADPQSILGDLGPEPLVPAFTAEALGSRLGPHRRQLKPLLLDQRVLAGLGNIYTDEALWLARLHPERPAHRLSPAEVTRLHAAIGAVLRGAIANKGTSLRDYRDPTNSPGAHQFCLAVYGRAGEPCQRCGSAIVRTVVGSRGTYYCPTCQTLSAEGAAEEGA